MTSPEKSGLADGLSRREFLKATGIVGAGLVLAPTLLAEEKPPPSDNLNVAVLGCGTQGRVLLEQALKIKGLRFKAVCDIWPYAQKYAAAMIKNNANNKQVAAVYTDYQDMLEKEKDLQAVIIATPDWMHAEHSIACMKSGLHVYCEKPISNSVDDARRMVQVSRSPKRLLQIGQQRRSDPRYLLCRNALLAEAKLLGRITHTYGQWNIPLGDDDIICCRVAENKTVYSHWNESRSAYGLRGYPKGQALDEATLKKYGYDTMDRFRDWRWYKKFGGGPLMDLGATQIDVLGWFLGSHPRAVMASGGLDFYKDRGWEWPDNAVIVYEFETPEGLVRASYQFLLTSGAGRHFETFMGTDGTLEVSEIPEHFRFCPSANLVDRCPSDRGEPLWMQWVKKGILVVVEEVPNFEKYSDHYVPLSSNRFSPATSDGFPQLYCGYSEESRFYCELVGKEVGNDPSTGVNPHLQNFFDAVRGNAKLTCPGEVGYATAVQVLRVNEAMATGKRVAFKEEDFKA